MNNLLITDDELYALDQIIQRIQLINELSMSSLALSLSGSMLTATLDQWINELGGIKSAIAMRHQTALDAQMQTSASAAAGCRVDAVQSDSTN